MPDTVWCDLTFPEGVHLQYSATLANSYAGRYEVFHGSNSAIKLAWTAGWMFKEAGAPTQGWEVYANRQQFHNDEGITLIADATQLAAQDKLKSEYVRLIAHDLKDPLAAIQSNGTGGQMQAPWIRQQIVKQHLVNGFSVNFF